MAFGANAVPRHYAVKLSTTAANTAVNALTVPANRALIISKVLVTNFGGTIGGLLIDVFAGSVAQEYYILASYSINNGETYTETGLVLLAGETCQIRCTTANAGINMQVFGEEVDAS